VLDYGPITYTVVADGGKTLTTQNILFKVGCPDDVAVIYPLNFNSPITTYVKGAGT
jgi:hypothetical protein